MPDLAQGCATLQRGGGPAGGTQTEPGTISLHQPRGGDGQWNLLSVGDPKIINNNTRNSLKGSQSHQRERCSGEHQHRWEKLVYAMRIRRQRPSC